MVTSVETFFTATPPKHILVSGVIFYILLFCEYLDLSFTKFYCYTIKNDMIIRVYMVRKKMH